MSEIWKDVPNYQKLYQVSNYGNARSLDHYSSDRFYKGRVLKPYGNGNGYLHVCLSKNGHGKVFRVHRIVANAFLPNHDKKLQVNHLNENKKDNEVTNLEWCTAKQNSNYGTRNKRISIAESKKVKQLGKAGNLIKIWPSLSEAERHGFGRGHLSDCAHGKAKLAYGYKWEYVEA